MAAPRFLLKETINSGEEKPEKCSPRQFRHLDFIAQFSTDIQYVPGSQNVVADALSRVDTIHATLDYKSLATSQQTDEELKVPLQGTDSGLHLKLLQMPESDVRIYCDVSTRTARPFITRPFRRTAFNSIHQLSHPSVNTTVKLVKERYVWPSISKDYRTWTRSCMDFKVVLVGESPRKTVLVGYIWNQENFPRLLISISAMYLMR
ncbi:hypothetical protein M8J77_023987 [Diaphorina citri]|nr:hypothetical protein M8J77_023987 [Diaphorina citri]